MSNIITIYRPASELNKKDEDKNHFNSVNLPSEIELDGNRISDQINMILRTFDSIDDSKSNYELNIIELELVVTASGKLAILGSGIETDAKAGIKVKIEKRKKSS